MIPEPPSALGLWPRVKDLSGWPLSDEDRVRVLAEAWRTGAAQFTTAGEFDPGPLAVHWPDTSGVAFQERVRGELRSALSSADAMQSLANRCDHLADVVIGVKTAIRTHIVNNLDRFAAGRALPPEDRVSVEESFVARMAADVNGMLAAGVDQIGGPPASAPAAPPPPEPSGGLLEGAVAFAGDLGNEVASFGSAVLNNPGLVVQAGAGAGLAALGGAAVLAGGGISLAPGGAAAGIPLTGAGLAGVAGGAALAGGAITALSAEADGADRVTPFGGSGAEAATPQPAAAPQPAAESQPAAEPQRPGANWDAVLGNKPDPDTIHVPPMREVHIIDGDGRVAGSSAGGGHLAGTGNPNKMEFPESWGPDQIIDTAVEVAKNPDAEPELQDNGFWKAVGTRDGVSVEVIVLPDGRVWTCYPTGGEGVIRNDEYGNPIPN